MPQGVFLDRDDTIIANDGDLGDPNGVVLIPGAAWGIRALREAGYCLVVVSNQGGVARGLYTPDDVERTNRRIAELLARDAQWTGGDPLVSGWYYCPYHPSATIEMYRKEHPWRKPSPGMLFEAAKDLQLDLESSWMVGDQERDVAAGIAAGCRTIRLLDSHEAHGDIACESAADFIEADLLHASNRILRADGRDGSPQWASTSRARIGAREGQLDDPSVQESVAAAARSLAEREGVCLTALEVCSDGVEAEVVGAQIVAVGFVAQLRRITNSWAISRGLGELWSPH